jgi:hypothetical protein
MDQQAKAPFDGLVFMDKYIAELEEMLRCIKADDAEQRAEGKTDAFSEQQLADMVSYVAKGVTMSAIACGLSRESIKAALVASRLRDQAEAERMEKLVKAFMFSLKDGGSLNG